MHTSVSRGAVRAWRLTLLSAALVSSCASQAADLYSAQMAITGITYSVSTYGDVAGTTPTVTMGGAPLSAYFYQEYDYSQAGASNAVSPDGTRQVQLASDAWSMSNSASQQDVAELWAAPFTPGIPGQGRLGVMVSTLPPEQFVLPSSEPSDYIQFTLSPYSQVAWSATMNFALTLDPQGMADTLKVHATDTIRPMLHAGGVFYGTPVPVGLDDAQLEEVLNTLGYNEIQESIEVSLEFDAQGNWTMVGQPGQAQRQLSTTFYNPFDTEITYAMPIFAGLEMVFYRKDLAFNPSGPVPEPGTWALMGLGLVGLTAVTRRRHARD
jgi:PEP-CTERM motif